eukprot:16440330-Heterocapsa_arctica.AAC.1
MSFSPCPPPSQLSVREGPGVHPRSGPVSSGHTAPELAQHQLKVISINSSAWSTPQLLLTCSCYKNI